MMSVERSDIKEVIKRWVEHTLQMEVKYTETRAATPWTALNIPYNKIN
jgi:hypothetical protein